MAKLSIILITHNESHWLINRIENLAKQDPDELIIVDNASTDRSQILIRYLMVKYPKIKFVENKENSGAFGGFILGARVATNDFVGCYSPDDDVMPNYIAKMRQVMTDYPMVDIFTCNTKVIREGKEYSRGLFPFDAYISPDYMVKICKIGMAKMINIVGMAVRKQVMLDMWERGGKYMKADFDAAFFFYMIFNKGVVNVGEDITIFRSFPNSWGPRGKPKDKKEAQLMAKELFKVNPEVYKRAVESRIWGTAYQLKQRIGLWTIMKLPKWAREMFYRWFYQYSWKIEKL